MEELHEKIPKKEKRDFDHSLFQESFSFKDDEYPRVSIIIPTNNCASIISGTLESLFEQDYPNYEIIIIDSNSIDSTLEIIKSYKHSLVRLYSVSEHNNYEMLNKGIVLATGNYLNFLFPGDYYLSKDTLKIVMGMALQHDLPSLVYCACILRDGRSDPKILFRHFHTRILRQGKQPTSLQSCWFRKEVFTEIGRFNTSFKQRGGYDLLCRFALKKGLKTVSIFRVLTDFEFCKMTREIILQHFKETGNIVYKYFGFSSIFIWLYKQHNIKRYFQHLFRSIYRAFIGR